MKKYCILYIFCKICIKIFDYLQLKVLSPNAECLSKLILPATEPAPVVLQVNVCVAPPLNLARLNHLIIYILKILHLFCLAVGLLLSLHR